jgi:ketosteroid isomerase-like protein
MKLASFALLASILIAPAVRAATPADVAAPLHKFIDAFNAGDTKTAFALYATGNITVVDEYAPYSWVGPHAGQDWAASYDKHAAATGVTDGKVTYGKTTRTVIEGDLAYVVIPTVYLYKEHGKPMQEEGQITAVLHSEAGGWKIRSWTWTGVNPHLAK